MLDENWSKSSLSTGGNCLEACWRKSTYSDTGGCLEARWHKSTHSTNPSGCVEARYDGVVQVRDTKQHGKGPVLEFSAAAWMEFLDGVKSGTLLS